MTAAGAIRCVWLRYFAVFHKSLKYAIVTTFFEPLLYLFAFGFGLGPMIGTVDVLGVRMSVPAVHLCRHRGADPDVSGVL